MSEELISITNVFESAIEELEQVKMNWICEELRQSAEQQIEELRDEIKKQKTELDWLCEELRQDPEMDLNTMHGLREEISCKYKTIIELEEELINLLEATLINLGGQAE